jgi:hypothetical protein
LAKKKPPDGILTGDWNYDRAGGYDSTFGIQPKWCCRGLHFRNMYPAIDKEWDNRVKGIIELISSDRGFRPGDGGYR